MRLRFGFGLSARWRRNFSRCNFHLTEFLAETNNAHIACDNADFVKRAAGRASLIFKNFSEIFGSFPEMAVHLRSRYDRIATAQMKYLDLTLPTPAANLALDEALLDACDEGGDEVLRVWEPTEYFVVVGYANHVEREVNMETCWREKIPVLRRCSGGGTVLQGPGCLNYSLILKIDSAMELQTVTGTNRFVMERHRKIFAEEFGLLAQFQGMTDLTIGDKKFSGNAQRRKRAALIFHGTFLLDFDLTLVEKLLPMPSKQPDYRCDRSHAKFLTNLGIPAARMKATLQEAWQAGEILNEIPDFSRLVEERYGRVEWNLKF